MNTKISEGRVVFPKTSSGRPMLKRYLNDLKTEINPLSSWMSNEAYQIGLNSEGTKVIQSLFDEKVFDYPKPVSLIELIISQITSKNSIILDSFAGSGTTAHAVLNLNKQDGGNRKFILIEMEDYAESITAERVKRVIKGYGTDVKPIEGTAGDFSYFELGEPIFLDNDMLNEAIGIERIEEYVWFSETKSNYEVQPEKYLLGKKDQTAYYFYYQKDNN